MAITVFSSLDELVPAVGRTLGTTDWTAVEGDRVALFRQALDLPADATSAAVPPMLLLSLSNLFLPAIVDIQGASAGVNYGTGPVRFPAPLPVGGRARGTAQLVAADEIPGGVQTVIRITVAGEGAGPGGSDAPVCVVDAMGRYLR